jgi:hypothetical protein
VLAAVLVGAIQRWWVAGHAIGTLTSDGAVIGLMALRLLHHGQLTAYMWGQSYGGSLEAVLTAAVFAVAGAGTSQLLATTALSSGLLPGPTTYGLRHGHQTWLEEAGHLRLASVGGMGYEVPGMICPGRERFYR